MSLFKYVVFHAYIIHQSGIFVKALVKIFLDNGLDLWYNSLVANTRSGIRVQNHASSERGRVIHGGIRQSGNKWADVKTCAF